MKPPAMTTAILWFRRDLRLTDNPALLHALAAADTIIPVFIFDPDEDGAWRPGAASRWWLHHSLQALDADLRQRGSQLWLCRGPSLDALRQIRQATGASQVYWNRLYEPAAIARDSAIKQALREDGMQVESCNSALWREPWEMTRGKGEPYKVFTPYWKALQQRGFGDLPQPAPARLPNIPAIGDGLPLADFGLLPNIAWDGGLRENWQPGEAGALALLDEFLQDAASRYSAERDLPDRPSTSRLAPHLHFGEIGPRQILAGLATQAEQTGAECYPRQLAWREFAHHLLYYFPATTDAPLDARFQPFAWNAIQPEALWAWQRGQTGIPLVDAGMRELWHTGWMHNRVRMVAASFLVKNLRFHWLEGARWFWDTLVDADLANNTLGWQWVAGCGADAAPYFRVFNPVLQGERFDPQGEYVRRWIPELAGLSARFIHQPWAADTATLQAAGVRLGMDYPRPIVDLKATRETALLAFKALRG
ncbi:MAG: cryptochrome/photolyase family protein [Candidatus Methylumidiphilus sp.]